MKVNSNNSVTRQFADKPTCGHAVKSRTGQLAEMFDGKFGINNRLNMILKIRCRSVGELTSQRITQ